MGLRVSYVQEGPAVLQQHQLSVVSLCSWEWSRKKQEKRCKARRGGGGAGAGPGQALEGGVELRGVAVAFVVAVFGAPLGD